MFDKKLVYDDQNLTHRIPRSQQYINLDYFFDEGDCEVVKNLRDSIVSEITKDSKEVHFQH
jgi:hypothetical protein